MLASLVSCVTTQPPEATSQQNAVVPEFKFPPPPPTAAPAPVQSSPAPIVTSDESILKEGINAYNNGDYNDAIKRLSNANDIFRNNGNKAGQLEAMKYIAFSYCVTKRQALCRGQFEAALKLEPKFDLAPGEKGHPLWGPVFLKAKNGLKKAAK